MSWDQRFDRPVVLPDGKRLRTLEDARRILGEYKELGQRDATRTVERLLAILDRNDVEHALGRMNRRRMIGWNFPTGCPSCITG